MTADRLEFNLNAYIKALSNPSILSGYKNTLFIVVVGEVVSMLLSCFGAYFMFAQGRNVSAGNYNAYHVYNVVFGRSYSVLYRCA